jgi:hypothetical protein
MESQTLNKVKKTTIILLGVLLVTSLTVTAASAGDEWGHGDWDDWHHHGWGWGHGDWDDWHHPSWGWHHHDWGWHNHGWRWH